MIFALTSTALGWPLSIVILDEDVGADKTLFDSFPQFLQGTVSFTSFPER
jgi:hypothetical protein